MHFMGGLILNSINFFVSLEIFCPYWKDDLNTMLSTERTSEMLDSNFSARYLFMTDKHRTTYNGYDPYFNNNL